MFMQKYLYINVDYLWKFFCNETEKNEAEKKYRLGSLNLCHGFIINT